MSDGYEEGSRDTLKLCANWLIFVGHDGLAHRFVEYARHLTGEAEAAPVATPRAATPAAKGLGPTTSNARQQARLSGYTGDACTNCQSVRVKRNGSCLVCDDCGTTTGCN